MAFVGLAGSVGLSFSIHQFKQPHREVISFPLAPTEQSRGFEPREKLASWHLSLRNILPQNLVTSNNQVITIPHCVEGPGFQEDTVGAAGSAPPCLGASRRQHSTCFQALTVPAV